MSNRITKNVARPVPIDIIVNGTTVPAYEGETLATALIASGTLIMSRDASGRPRSPFCNMGVCFDCMVTVEESIGLRTPPRRVRACLTAVRPGLRITVAEK
jgi:D-hydroxyproline dehydrogenase subunit gamma